MANPVLIKLAIAAAADKRTWKVVAVIIAAVLSPIILLVMVVLVVFSGGSEYNRQTAEYIFSGVPPPIALTTEQREFIEKTKENLSELDKVIEEKQSEINEGSLDSNKIKAVFLSLDDQIDWDDEAYEVFINCFIREREITVDGIKTTETVYDTHLTSVVDKISSAFPEAEITDRHTQFINSMYEYLKGMDDV